MDELKTMVEMINGGGNAALLVSVYFIWRLERRLARIEKALERFLPEIKIHGSLT